MWRAAARGKSLSNTMEKGKRRGTSERGCKGRGARKLGWLARVTREEKQSRRASAGRLRSRENACAAGTPTPPPRPMALASSSARSVLHRRQENRERTARTQAHP